MRKRELGRSGLQVAPLALGGNVFGWTADQQRSFAVLDAFVANGFNLIDTADVYSNWVKGHVGGESESMIGRWLEKSGRRADVLIATKVGMEMGGEKGLRRNYILKAVDRSLARLKTDYIDLYQAHKDDTARRSRRRSAHLRISSKPARCARSARRTTRPTVSPRRCGRATSWGYRASSRYSRGTTSTTASGSKGHSPISALASSWA